MNTSNTYKQPINNLFTFNHPCCRQGVSRHRRRLQLTPLNNLLTSPINNLLRRIDPSPSSVALVTNISLFLLYSSFFPSFIPPSSKAYRAIAVVFSGPGGIDQLPAHVVTISLICGGVALLNNVVCEFILAPR